MKNYDLLLVGTGLFNAVIAYEAKKRGLRSLVIEKRNHIGGNIYTENIDGINVHKYGAHIFHTDSKYVWNYVNQFAEFNRYTNSPIANYNGEIYNLPFNMNTFNKLWPDVITPEQAKKCIELQASEIAGRVPQNLEEQAISLVGRDIYTKLIKGYTEKQWGRSCKELPAEIIKRLPVRFIYDNNYFNDKYQGIPIGGYTKIIEKMLENVEVKLGIDYLSDKKNFNSYADKIIYSGTIDSYFEYCFGELEYRSLRFETETIPEQNYQGNAVVNYTDASTPYTRIIEHKHFEPENEMGLNSDKTIITKEYPADWKIGEEPYYPLNNDKNSRLYAKYKILAQNEPNVVFGGRLGMYKYFDMDDTIAEALRLSETLFTNKL